MINRSINIKYHRKFRKLQKRIYTKRYMNVDYDMASGVNFEYFSGNVAQEAQYFLVFSIKQCIVLSRCLLHLLNLILLYSTIFTHLLIIKKKCNFVETLPYWQTRAPISLVLRLFQHFELYYSIIKHLHVSIQE